MKVLHILAASSSSPGRVESEFAAYGVADWLSYGINGACLTVIGFICEVNYELI